MRIYNTLTRTKEEFVPLVPGKVGLYACGPTVYNYFHIGNARPFIVFDTLRRYFEYLGYDVTFVQNFTDIDDKMINKANEEGITVKELADRYIAEYYKDADALGIRRASVNPKATDHIAEIIAIVRSLIEKGHAYATDNGDVYFATRSFDGYGKLSGQPLNSLESGARVDPREQKREPMDFALWKAQKPGEPAWDSPWGKGRPGWHIECSAMSMKYLGESFDIHAGGMDLIFPHHENEIAQSEACTGKPFARYWMHNGYINVDNQKMSKSLGNFFTVREVSAEYDLEVVRLFMLSAQYRNPVNFSRELMDQAKSALERLRNTKTLLASAQAGGEADAAFTGAVEAYKADFIAAMDDDLNTADALGVLFELAREINIHLRQPRPQEEIDAAAKLFSELTGVLGILQKSEDIPSEIIEMAQERQQARAAKDWAKADQMRAAISEKGYSVEDKPEGFVLKKLG